MHEYSFSTTALLLVDVVINKTNLVAVLIVRLVHVLI